MKLNLRSREIDLANGLKIKVRPLTAGEYQEFLGHIARVNDGSMTNITEAAFTKLVSDPEALSCAKRLIESVIVGHDSFIVEEDSGERPGKIDDLWYGANGLGLVMQAISQISGISVLTETEAKN